ncbi:MAG: phosphoribosylamine--glycine ligase [Chloroflexota bacterium]|nr:phosphoribosylamine--glycine ligase [Chloroflexota bacterium]
MKVLVIGSGAREHAIAWKLRASPHVTEMFTAPGNIGTDMLGTNLDVAAIDVDGLLAAAKSNHIDLTVVGPEAALEAGIVDRFRAEGLTIAGPSQAAARIETSKAFAKGLMLKYKIPTGKAELFTSYGKACSYVEQNQMPVVVKADGLAAGKGVVVCQTPKIALQALREVMEDRVFGAAGDQILVEECLFGQEISVFTFTDGVHLSPLVSACDYKRAGDGDKGPNTGGMGSYSPPRVWDTALSDRIMLEIMAPIVKALADEGTPFQGVLYGGIILTPEGPKVIEFNARWGDPETQTVLPRLQSDLVELYMATINGTVNETTIQWSEEACVAVVLASGGYPGDYKTGFPINGLDGVDDGVSVFHAGTQNGACEGLSLPITSSGRVLTVAATGTSLEQARQRAYNNVTRISFEGAKYRKDIAR